MSRRLLACLVVASALLVAIPSTAADALQSTVPSSSARPWSIVASANHGSDQNQLNAVSCVRAQLCIAVGQYLHDGVSQTLAETDLGGRWSIVPSPNTGTSDNALSGVSCTSARSCVAVGDVTVNGDYETLVESWNGIRWSTVTSPNVDNIPNSVLTAVSCVSARSCVAVGWSFDANSGLESTLIESWNGVVWSIVPSANRALAGNIFSSVSCVSSTSCVAVGYTSPNEQPPVFETLIESWNGTSWSIVPSPNQPTSASLLLSVFCFSANACQAVGEYNVGLGNYQTLIESWKGTSWSIVPSPNGQTIMTGLRTDVNDLIGVSCTSANACEAVGLYFNVGLANYQTLIESWNGTSWTLVPSPNGATDGYNALASVSCPRKPHSCTAVGNYFNPSSNNYQTLIETSR